MREVYVPDKSTYKMYHDFFNQSQHGGGYSQGYVYNNHQVGAGLGGFFRRAMQFAMPLGKKLLYKGWQIAKPEVKKIAKSGAGAITRVVEEKVNTASNNIQKRLDSVGKRRKVDALGS